MRLIYINPNSTEEMTRSLVGPARLANPEAEILGWTNTEGPPAIQGPEDGAAAVPGILARLPEARAAGADAVIIGCFDDTGLDAVRRAAHCPVLGIGQAAYLAAAMQGHRFSVVTTLAVSVPVIEGNIAAQGFGSICASVRASGLPVLVVEEGQEATRQRLADEIRAAVDEDGATAVVLGCAGMSALADDLARRTGVPLIDGVAAAAHLAPVIRHLSVGGSGAA